MEKTEELIVANLVLPIIKDLVLPKVKSIIRKLSIKNFDESLIESNFQEYLRQRYERYLIIDTLVFPNKQTLFKELYEPLTIITKTDGKKVEIKIKDYPNNFLPKYFRAIIEDTAGMGKSTITKKLFLSIIEQNAGIPILIELRKINNDNDFLKELQNQLSQIGKQIPSDFILSLLNEGQFIFLFDGFDEISKSDKNFVIKDLHRFIEKANNNHFLITSRSEDSLVSFGDFHKFYIKPLDEDEASSLINRYDSYSFKPIAKELFKQIKGKKDKTLNEFLTNPFLVSLLYKSFDYKKDIPIKKCQFFRQVYDALYESFDLSKEGYLKREKNSNLHLDDFERVLRHIGYFTSIENKVEYEKNYIINIIDKVKKYVPDLSFKSSDYLKDLLETVPLFKKDGNYIKWAHKSIQDYFAAKFIWIDSGNDQNIILKKIYKDKDNKRFYNILDLFYELDSNIFDRTILLNLLEDFQDYNNKKYSNFQSIPKSLIEERIENNFHKNCVIVVTRSEDFDKIRQDINGGNEILKYYQKKVSEIDSKLIHHINYNYFKKQKVVVLTFINVTSNIDTILELVSNRIPELAKYKMHKVNLKDLKILEEDHIYPVNDNKDNIINNDSIFGLVNDLIISDYTLNYKNCFKKLKQIKAINKHRLENDFTNW